MTGGLINTPIILYYIFVVPNLFEINDTLGLTILIINVILNFLNNLIMTIASCKDPGILPKNVNYLIYY